MIAATLAPLLLADGDPDRAIALASALALIVGAVTILAGAFHLGFVADLLSKPTQIGYMNGLALTILGRSTPEAVRVLRGRRRPDRRGDRLRARGEPG
jgi:MFS superfamily sulfate permease-like transporter